MLFESYTGANARTSQETAAVVFLEILLHGPMARTTVASRVRRSNARVSRVVSQLLSAGLIEERPAAGAARSGRPLVPLAAVATTHHFVGIKLNADHFYAVVCDMHGQIVDSRSVHLANASLDAVVAAITLEVGALKARWGTLAATGIAIGGNTLDRRIVSHASFLKWDSVDLAGLIQQRTGIPTWVENDVRALTQAEHWFGAGKGLTSFAVATLGAGVGLGLVTDDRLIVGANHMAGAIGHQLITGSDAVCELGHVGCARANLATPFILERAAKLLDRPVVLEELINLAAAGNATAGRLCEDVARSLGILLSEVINVIDPRTIIISGEGAPLLRTSLPLLQQEIDHRKHWLNQNPTLVLADFDFTEWARGAAAVAMQMTILGTGFDRMLASGVEPNGSAALQPSVSEDTRKSVGRAS